MEELTEQVALLQRLLVISDGKDIGYMARHQIHLEMKEEKDRSPQSVRPLLVRIDELCEKLTASETKEKESLSAAEWLKSKVEELSRYERRLRATIKDNTAEIAELRLLVVELQAIIGEVKPTEEQIWEDETVFNELSAAASTDSWKHLKAKQMEPGFFVPLMESLLNKSTEEEVASYKLITMASAAKMLLPNYGTKKWLEDLPLARRFISRAPIFTSDTTSWKEFYMSGYMAYLRVMSYHFKVSRSS